MQNVSNMFLVSNSRLRTQGSPTEEKGEQIASKTNENLRLGQGSIRVGAGEIGEECYLIERK